MWRPASVARPSARRAVGACGAASGPPAMRNDSRARAQFSTIAAGGRMRIVVAGAGGGGVLIGGVLARAGAEGGFVARGAQLAVLRAGGLHVESPRGTFHVPT